MINNLILLYNKVMIILFNKLIELIYIIIKRMYFIPIFITINIKN